MHRTKWHIKGVLYVKVDYSDRYVNVLPFHCYFLCPLFHHSHFPWQHTHLLSAEECIMAADFQNQNPNPCNLAKKGYFGSKFVTVCVSGKHALYFGRLFISGTIGRQ